MKKNILSSNATVSPPPPPSPSKGSRKMLMAAIVIVIIVVAAVVGAYFIMRNGSTSSSNNPTSSPGTSATPGSGVAGATSIQYSISETVTNQTLYSGSNVTINTLLTDATVSAKNLGTPNMMIRVEGHALTTTGVVMIINGAQQKEWVYSGGAWSDTSNTVTWNTWTQSYNMTTGLAGWSGTGDYTHTASGVTLRIYNIVVNPELADSLFQP